MEFPTNTEVMVAIGGAIAAAWGALRGRKAVQRVTDTELERWASVAAERAWRAVRRDERVLLGSTFREELTRLSTWAGLTIPPDRAQRVLAIAVETWLRLTAQEAGEAAERLVAQIDRWIASYDRLDAATVPVKGR